VTKETTSPSLYAIIKNDYSILKITAIKTRPPELNDEVREDRMAAIHEKDNVEAINLPPCLNSFDNHKNNSCFLFLKTDCLLLLGLLFVY
jgi:hypothetical protein